jgi:hypothetical protein
MLGQFAKARNADPTADRQDFLETLRDTSGVLMALRMAIAVGGHVEAMAEIDSLLAVAQSETNRRLAAASN